MADNLAYRQLSFTGRFMTARWAMVFIVLAGFVLRALFIGNGSLWPDEALYLFLGRNLIDNPFVLKDIDGQPFFKNPPLFFYALSAIGWICRGLTLSLGQFYNVLVGTGTILLTYGLGKKLFGTFSGLIAAALIAVNPLHSWISTRVVTDVQLTFLIYLAIYFIVCGRKLAFYFCAAAGIATKYPALPILVLPLFSEARIKQRPWVWLTSIATVSCVLLLAIMGRPYWFTFSGELRYFINFVGAPDWKEIVRETHFFLGWILVLLSLYGTVRCLIEGRFNALVIWILLFGTLRLFLPWMAFRMSRYSLPLYPGLCVLAAYGIVHSYNFAIGIFPSRKKLIEVILFLVFLYTIVIHGYRSFWVSDINKNTFVGFEPIGYLGKDTFSGARILSSSTRQVKYYAPNLDVVDLTDDLTCESVKCLIIEKGIDFVAIDKWSPHQPAWAPSCFSSGAGLEKVFSSQYMAVYAVEPKFSSTYGASCKSIR